MGLYYRLFDQPDPEARIDPSAVDWIREHAPLGDRAAREVANYLRFASRRNARRIRQAGWFLVVLSIGNLAVLVRGMTHEIPYPLLVLEGFACGLLLGASQLVLLMGRLFRMLALLKGDRGDEAVPARSEARAR